MNRKITLVSLLLVGWLLVPGIVEAQGCASCPAAISGVSCMTVEQFQFLRQDFGVLRNGYGWLDDRLSHAFSVANRLEFRPDCRKMGTECLHFLDKTWFFSLQYETSMYVMFPNDTIRLFCRLNKAHMVQEVIL